MQDKLTPMIPGPTPVPETVLKAIGRHPIGHRSGDFQEIVRRTTEQLQWLHQTSGDVLVITGSGTAVRLAANGLPFAEAGEWTMRITATTSLGPVESELLPFIVFEADGSAATTTLAIPQASLVPVTTAGS